AEELGLPTSTYRFADNEASFHDAVAAVGFPCIVKPVMSSSGKQRQLKTLQQWEKEFKAATPEDDIELYTGKDVQQVIGSDVYCG
ncbi:ATP-grasp domain-containing protein, partial [Salmonella enterica subsp. enterica serovar Montevideo]|nr:ATP-grasp domain-containing protein [Salmonella enterica subsp. enterica serovar Montevideo]